LSGRNRAVNAVKGGLLRVTDNDASASDVDCADLRGEALMRQSELNRLWGRRRVS
jgi:hypothetical protein